MILSVDDSRTILVRKILFSFFVFFVTAGVIILPQNLDWYMLTCSFVPYTDHKINDESKAKVSEKEEEKKIIRKPKLK